MPTKYIHRNSDYLSQPHSGKKAPPKGTDADLNLATLTKLFHNEDAAREWLEEKRWPNGPVCPRCGCTNVYKLTAKEGSKHPVRPGVYKCPQCRKAKTADQFTVRIGTIFEESKIPICKWLMAFHLMTSSKKGVSSHQLARELDITVKSAWFLSHRIREAMKKEPVAGMLSGTIETDEAYVGGKPRPASGQWGAPAKRGHGTKKKPVQVLVERDGNAVCQPVAKVAGTRLKGEIRRLVNKDSMIITDELPGYRGIGKEFTGGHRSVNHGFKEYARRDSDGVIVTTNTAESFFAILKRSHYGIHHSMSREHLFRYCNERSFMWDHRKLTDGERMVAAIVGAEGKRLMYREPVANEESRE